jgi:prepilin-type processing-associated H-X9-DG protein
LLHGYEVNQTSPIIGNPSKFVRSTQLVTPGPALTFVFVDEHENTINDGTFAVFRRGINRWADTPANRHGQAANFSYADGHAARQEWRWPKQCKDMQYL